MKLTDLLRRTAEANPQAATLHSIADKAEELVEKRYSVRRMLREMESFAHDTEAMRLTVDALRQLPYLPTLEQRDYKPYMALVACSPVHIPADTRSAFPVISVQSPVSIQCCWQS